MPSVTSYIRRLSVQPHTGDLENPYRGRSRAARVRKDNLQRYLERMQALNPRVLLLGEAPGYNGCCMTGIPFTSERSLLEEPFLRDLGCAIAGDPDRPQSENSGTIVWETIRHWERPPLIWNIFPFHPHKPGDLKSNRAPRAPELKEGLLLLKRFLKLYDVRMIGAVGRKAEGMVGELGISFQYIRHPSYGGKRDFLRGMEEISTHQL